jgi:hypothetical protein
MSTSRSRLSMSRRSDRMISTTPTAVEARSWAHCPRDVSAGWHPRLQPDRSASRAWPKQARPLRVRKCLSVRRVNLMQNCRAMTGGPTHPAAADRSRIGNIAVRFWRGPGASRGRVLCAIRTQPCERAVSRPTRGGSRPRHGRVRNRFRHARAGGDKWRQPDTRRIGWWLHRSEPPSAVTAS